MASRGKSHSAATSSQKRGTEADRSRGQKSTITRVRTGCFTCRKRKKKCDERRPVCANCQKTGVVCEGFPAQVLWETRAAARRASVISNTVRRANSAGFQTPVASSGQTPDFGLVFVQDGTPANQIPPNDNQTFGFMNQHQFDEDLDFIFNQLEGPANISVSPIPTQIAGDEVGSFHGKHGDSQGSLIAREDESNQQVAVMRNSSQQSYMPMELPFIISGVESAIQQRLFCHFTSVMSNLLTTNVGESNPMNSVVIPLALADRTVMDTLLCLAGSHLLKLKTNDTNEEVSLERRRLHEEALQTQSHRMQTLKSSSPSAESLYTLRDQEVLLATSLLLCLYEICEGIGDDAWRIYLDMAREVITFTSRSADGSSTNSEIVSTADPPETIVTEVDPFLLEFFLYHDSLASVTVPSIPVIKPRLQNTADLADHDPYMIGVQDGLSEFITRISLLRAQADASPLQPDGAVVCKAVLIWQDLAHWKPEPFFSKERKLIAEFYQWALFIWLFSIVYPDGKADEKVQGAVQRVAAGMCEIKSGDGVMSCILFPLFVIGSAAISVQDRAAVSAQFRRLRAWSSLGNIDLTYRVVEKMWSDHDLGLPRSWDWVKQLERHGMSLLVT